MADRYALSLQKALIATLKADAGVKALVSGRIYDEPPQNAKRPFIRIGAIEVQPLRSDAKKAATLTFGIEAHSRPIAGRVDATKCAQAVVSAIDGASPAVGAYTPVTMQFLTQSVTPDADAKSYTAVCAFRTILDG